MKKFIVVSIQLLMAASLTFSAPAKKSQNSVSKPVVLDWQDKDDDEPIPEWAAAVLDGRREPVEEELGLEGYRTWIFDSRGPNLSFIRTWTDVSDLAVNVSREFSSRVERVAMQQVEVHTAGEKESVTTGAQIIQNLFTNMEIRGLQQFGSFWIKQGYVKDGVKKAKNDSDYNIVYIYLSVWGMSDELYRMQLDGILKKGKKEVPSEYRSALEKTIDALSTTSADSGIIVNEKL